MSEKAIIIGAGPAGLTAAYELVMRTDIQPIIIEQSNDIGGISKTVLHNGNRMDIGGHRFFSKSDVVMKWWQEILPLQGSSEINEAEITYQNRTQKISLNENGPDPDKTDRVMLIRNRLSRIYFLRKFFDYPIKMNSSTFGKLGLVRLMKIGFSYMKIRMFPIRKEKNLEEFLINRFGKELYQTFFKDYTEKVWGVPCHQISAEWGAQRIKGISISKAIRHALSTSGQKSKDISQKGTDTSFISKFMYPKFGPGQMWETVAKIIEGKGGIIIRNSTVDKFEIRDSKMISLQYSQKENKEPQSISGNYFFSTMPIKDLINSMGNIVPSEVKIISEGLQYRDFITVGLLVDELKISDGDSRIKDNWIYIQEKNVKLGRLQIYNNWSPYMVADPKKIWLGLEYFCNEGDQLWQMNEDDFVKFAIQELESIGIIDSNKVSDSKYIRMPKTYPAYFGTYPEFHKIREYTDSISNLFLIGRNGMHKYNNQDHSMLTAMAAVENIIGGITSKENIWNINTHEEYHEEND